MTLAPAIAAIHELQRLKLVERSAEMGAYLGEKLRALKEKHPCIGEVRGLGLFWAIDLVKNRTTRAPFNTMEDKFAGRATVVDKVGAEIVKAGVAVVSWISHFVIAPPLIIEKEQLDDAIAAFDNALSIADALVE
jgi:taurine--2-oxoglutarate transaminase